MQFLFLIDVDFSFLRGGSRISAKVKKFNVTFCESKFDFYQTHWESDSRKGNKKDMVVIIFSKILQHSHSIAQYLHITYTA